MNEINAFPTRLIGNLNARRNLVEHEYQSVKREEAADFVDIAEMFLLLAFPFLKKAVIGAYVGIDGDDRCLEWRIDHPNKEVQVLLVHCKNFLDTPIGRVYFNIDNNDERSPLLAVPIKRENSKEWLPFVDLFVYCTKRFAVKLPPPDSKFRGLVRESHTMTFHDLDETKEDR
jgi:hypothetical protein